MSIPFISPERRTIDLKDRGTIPHVVDAANSAFQSRQSATLEHLWQALFGVTWRVVECEGGNDFPTLHEEARDEETAGNTALFAYAM